MHLLTVLLYQPFFNILVFYYYLLDQIPGHAADMGIAVILLTLTIRILMLPLTLASTRTQKERRAIEDTIKQAKKDLGSQPVKLKKEIRSTFKANRRIVISEGINFFIQMMIFFILYKIFTSGLLGADSHLLYSFMPKEIHYPFNLMFLGKYDLSHPNITLNFIQSITIALLESLNLIDSPFPITRDEMIRYVIILPLASFLLFLMLPAGKKLFVITTLWFSIIYTLIRMLRRQLSKILDKLQNLGIKQTSADPPPDTPAASASS